MSTDAGRPDAGERLDNHAGGHIDIDELADDAEGLLSPERTAAVAAHLAGCERCRSNAAALAEVSDLMATAPAVSMPDALYARLQDTIAAEQRLRQSQHATGRFGPSTPLIGTGHQPYVDQSGQPSAKGGGRFPKPHIAEHFTETAHRRRGLRAKFAVGALGAALVASTAGFGGYVLSAAAGANEPPIDQPIVVANAESLASSASSAAAEDLNAYRFSRTWRCARRVTDGTITGIRSTVLDGQHGFLVFLDTGSGKHAVFVTGCETGTPTAGPTVRIDH